MQYELLPRTLSSDFRFHRLPDRAESAEFFNEVGPKVRGVVSPSDGDLRLDGGFLAKLPNLEIVAFVGAGYENIDMKVAMARGLTVTNTAGANAVDVAEHAMALILDVARRISEADRYVRTGKWVANGRMAGFSHRVTGRKLGILGLGNIGLAIAKCAAGFAMPVSYCNRKPRPDLPYRYVSTVLELARDADILVCATPGGPETHHMIDRAVLDALGRNGILVNVGRGSIVDEDALVDALTDRRLGGAGLDVFENEPHVPERLMTLPNVVLQPHHGGATQQAVPAIFDLVAANLRAYFLGGKIPTPVYRPG